MEQMTQKSTLKLIAAILLFVGAACSIFQLIGLLDYAFIYVEFVDFLNILAFLAEAAGFVLAGIGIMKEDKKKLKLLGFAIVVAAAFVFFIAGFMDGSYEAFYSWGYYYDDFSYSFSFVCVLPALVNIVAMAAVAAFACADQIPALAKHEAAMKKLWFVPAIAVAAVVVIALLALVIIRASIYDSWLGYTDFLGTSAIIQALVLVGYVVISGLDNVKSAAGQVAPQQNFAAVTYTEKVCPNCGNVAEAAFCTNCGTKMEEIAPAAPQAAPAPQAVYAAPQQTYAAPQTAPVQPAVTPEAPAAPVTPEVTPEAPLNSKF